MEVYGQEAKWTPAGTDMDTGTGLEESMQRLSLWGREAYPERPGVPYCNYYMRTGLCKYGARCRYHHPRDRRLVGGAVGSGGGGEYPERVGMPACHHYLRTGTCKFGAFCKYHHPRNSDGSSSNIPLNIYGYPLRPGERECVYYMKTGWCKFGFTCKYDHPNPAGSAGTSMPATARPFYPSVQTLSVPSTDQYGGPSTSYRVARPPPPLPGSYVPGAYGPVLVHPGVVPIPNWTPYSGSVSAGAHASAGAASPYGISQLATSAPVHSGTYPLLSAGAHASAGAASPYGISQLATSAPVHSGTNPLLSSSSGPSSSDQMGKHFPERPGELECQFYMKTGDCKFGSSCRYHHPPEVLASMPNCALSPSGLPLRPGMPPCTFYLQNGGCKFGRACIYDHPMETVKYNGSEFRVDPHVRSFPSSGNNLRNSVIFSNTHPIPISSSNDQLPGQGSSSIIRSTREDG